LVRKERLELSRLAALVPKTSASTNSATLACSSKRTTIISAYYSSLVKIGTEKFNLNYYLVVDD
jgi:hypothetical protein